MRGTGPVHATRRAGFTLIELLMVVVIMTAIAGMAIPRYASSLARYRVEAAAQRIIADLAMVQQTVRTTGSGRTIVFDTTLERYTAAGITGLGSQSPLYAVEMSKAPYEADIVSVDFGGGSTITFDGYGTPDSGGIIVVRVGSFTQQLDIDINVGRVTATTL